MALLTNAQNSAFIALIKKATGYILAYEHIKLNVMDKGIMIAMLHVYKANSHRK